MNAFTGFSRILLIAALLLSNSFEARAAAEDAISDTRKIGETSDQLQQQWAKVHRNMPELGKDHLFLLLYAAQLERAYKLEFPEFEPLVDCRLTPEPCPQPVIPVEIRAAMEEIANEKDFPAPVSISSERIDRLAKVLACASHSEAYAAAKSCIQRIINQPRFRSDDLEELEECTASFEDAVEKLTELGCSIPSVGRG